MARKHLMILLPALAGLALAAVWTLLDPEGGLFFIGSNDRESSQEIAVVPQDPVDRTEDRADRPSADEESPLNQSRERRQNRRTEAERKRTEEAPVEAGAEAEPRPDTGRRQGGGGEDAQAAEKAARLEAERKRRIEALREVKRPPNQSLGNRRPRARRLNKEVGKKDLDELRQDRRGLYAKYYAFPRNPLEDLLDPEKPTLDQRTPQVTRIDRNVHFPSKDAWADLPFDKRNFMGVWEGFLVIEEEADYWLYIGADYSGRVVLSGETVLLNDMRDYTEVSTVLTLSEGLHPIRIEYMEGENGSPVDPLGACNFMWVPEDESKPVPVPPEMLMLPEELWSDSAPIITRLSRDEGEIGDEITIHGENFGTGEMNDLDDIVWYEAGEEVEGPVPTFRISANVAGQPAEILARTDRSLKIRIPIGAQSGSIVVFSSRYTGQIKGAGLGVITYSDPIPSNSMDFTVATQFGLFASWHNLQGWSNYDFVDETMHEPDVVRLERDFRFDSRQKLDFPFRDNPLACNWEGKLGIPAGWGSEDEPFGIWFEASGGLRVTLGNRTKTDPSYKSVVVFDFTTSEETCLPLSIDWFNESGPAHFLVFVMAPRNTVRDGAPLDPSEYDWVGGGELRPELLFPPVVPPKAPRILDAAPIYDEGEQPPQLPYDITTTRPSIREGQQFEFQMEVFGNAEVQETPVAVTVDGETVEYSVTETETGNGRSIRTCVGTLPSGLGEGAMTPRLTVVTGEPFHIDVQNKGLIAYLYDLPNPGGYQHMPDPGPLTCFQVRKDRQVDFENANDFDLPFPAETFAMEWYGGLIVEEEGFYRFTCRSDDGILVWLDGNLVVEDDNLHYQRERTGDWVHLTPGTYDFRMNFFENNVHEVCVLEWEARTASGNAESEFVARQVIPKRHFTWDQHPPLPAKTSTFKRADGSDPE